MARECQEDKKTPIPPWVLKRALWSAHTAQPTALTSMPHGKSLLPPLGASDHSRCFLSKVTGGWGEQLTRHQGKQT